MNGARDKNQMAKNRIKLQDIEQDIELVVIKGDARLGEFTNEAGEIEKLKFTQFLENLHTELKCTPT